MKKVSEGKEILDGEYVFLETVSIERYSNGLNTQGDASGKFDKGKMDRWSGRWGVCQDWFHSEEEL